VSTSTAIGPPCGLFAAPWLAGSCMTPPPSPPALPLIATNVKLLRPHHTYPFSTPPGTIAGMLLMRLPNACFSIHLPLPLPPVILPR
jgi:hypothetical protein